MTFILSANRIVTVRHHVPRPFETYPDRAEKVSPGCQDPQRIFLSLMGEIVGRLARPSGERGQGARRGGAHGLFRGGLLGRQGSAGLAPRVGRESELIGRVRLALLTLERALSFFTNMQGVRGQGSGTLPTRAARHQRRRGRGWRRRPEHRGACPALRGKAVKANAEALRQATKALVRDIQSLEVHADFLSSRVAMASDAALGIINLAQAQTIKIFSVLAVVFLPPTVIASAYGMNFDVMPELHWAWAIRWRSA